MNDTSTYRSRLHVVAVVASAVVASAVATVTP